jgi:hypothetical protein
MSLSAHSLIFVSLRGEFPNIRRGNPRIHKRHKLKKGSIFYIFILQIIITFDKSKSTPKPLSAA